MTGKSAGPSTTRRWLAVPVAGSIVNSYSPEGRPGPCRGRRTFEDVAGSISGQSPVQMWTDRRAGPVSAEAKVDDGKLVAGCAEWRWRAQSAVQGSEHPGLACGRAHCELLGQTPAGVKWDLTSACGTSGP